jgi:hypothetical protein
MGLTEEQGKVSWAIVRKTPADDSTLRNWHDQQALFSNDEIVPTARIMVYTIVGYRLATGERMLERNYACISTLNSEGRVVYVSDVGFILHYVTM